MTTENKATSQKIDFSYFELSLLHFLTEYHPDMVNDIEFIKMRAGRAAAEEEKAVLSGYNQIGAEEISRKVLYQDLEFSLFSTIKTLLEDFCTDSEINERALELLPTLKPLLSKYEINDSFDETVEYDQLCDDIKIEIAKTYGVQ